MTSEVISLCVNGRKHLIALDPNVTLLTVLRDLGYVDVKCGCEKGDCGACAVLLALPGAERGEAVNSCLVLAWQADGAAVTTAAGLGTGAAPHPIQAAFADTGAIQCGYCTPGLVVAAKALLDRTPHPTEDEIREAIVGNLCRCTGYGHIIEAIRVAADKLSAGKGGAR
jgi:aerobic-type carbon monoxide dehydrogenase small subunit (CoxS/CutS family)